MAVEQQNTWLTVNNPKVDNMISNLILLNMQNADLAGMTSFSAIINMLRAMRTEIERCHNQNLTLQKMLDEREIEGEA